VAEFVVGDVLLVVDTGELLPWQFNGKRIQLPQVCHQIALCSFASQV